MYVSTNQRCRLFTRPHGVSPSLGSIRLQEAHSGQSNGYLDLGQQHVDTLAVLRTTSEPETSSSRELAISDSSLSGLPVSSSEEASGLHRA